MSAPLRFVFGVHLHQPVGNFDHVFADHVRDAYLPFLQRVAAARCLPLTLHVSGPLLEWLETHDSAYLDLIGTLAADGQVELLLAGFYEPILAVLPRADRIEQITWMRDALRRRFGVEATGLWLTERIWEPELAADLHDAGVRYALVDDRHFLVSGFPREKLHAPFRTESDGKGIALLPIDERLRYLVPFRPPAETAVYLRELRAAGRELAVLADDGEKFGGWPGTHDWVYRRGWLEAFLQVLTELTEAGEIRLTRGADAVAQVPSGGLAYLPTASYREMEGWALPPDAATRLVKLEEELGHDRMAGADGALVRGAHWRNFLVKYSESNRMHKTMVALSQLCRERGDPPAARRALGRAQCNDAYWHGVFGGLYLPHLRHAVWRELATAERELRRGEALACETRDLDGDGYDELWVHSAHFSALVSPVRGGATESFVRFATGVNLADVLTRRREGYHVAAVAAAEAARESNGHRDGAPRDHDNELSALPPTDTADRSLVVERVLASDLSRENYLQGGYPTLRSWTAPMASEVWRDEGALIVDLTADGLEKQLRFSSDGRLEVEWRWDPGAFPADAVFAVELSLAHAPALACHPPAETWRDPIATMAKSERGLEATVQGEAVTVRWPISLGAARVEMPAEDGT